MDFVVAFPDSAPVIDDTHECSSSPLSSNSDLDDFHITLRQNANHELNEFNSSLNNSTELFSNVNFDTLLHSEDDSSERSSTQSNEQSSIPSIQDTTSSTNIISTQTASCARSSELQRAWQATQLTYTERWQCQHVAKAVVDNAINKTLEEMGLAPAESEDSGQYHRQRSRMEDTAVSHTIRHRGLHQRGHQSERMRHLDPIITRLTQVSENIFSHNMQTGWNQRRETSHNDSNAVAPVHSVSDVHPPNIAAASSESNHQGTRFSKSLVSELYPDDKSHAKLSSSSCDSSQSSENDAAPADAEEMVAVESCPMPSTSFILNQAVNAAISEQGLQLQ